MQTYAIRTFGCQMNRHDAERVSGLLADQGMTHVDEPEDADVVVFMTCCVRENADVRLTGQVASLKSIKTGGRPELLIAVGGCIGQRDGQKLLDQLPHVDVVFGTHNVESLPVLLDSAAKNRSPAVEILDTGDGFTSDLPSKREHPWHAWVPITVGCDNYCSYCVVPYVRGRERSRPFEDVVGEAERLRADGVLEVTLLGQNVNSYGRDLYGGPRFSEILRAVGETGIDRIRFATSHPKDLSPATISAIAEVEAVMPYVHLPFQSGSNRILQRMNRGYTREMYLGLVDQLRSAIPDVAISTDVIVGFPGEREEDFADTLDLADRVGFDQAFTFIYSPREGTPAALMDGQVPREVIQKRFDELVVLIQASALSRNRALVGSVQDVLIEGPSKRDGRMLAGRTPGNKVAHAPVPEGHLAEEYSGCIERIAIDEAQNWFISGRLEGTNTE